MNFLFHMILSGDDEQLLVGNFMGDFVKGPLQNRFPPRIRHGVYMHRKIDSHADRHPVYRRSRQRLSPEYGLFRGVMLDLFYDHLLCNGWEAWCEKPFDRYLAGARVAIERHRDSLPVEMRRLVPFIFHDLLPSYATIAGIGKALSRLSRRITRANPLCGGEAELRRNFDGLMEDFNLLTPELFRFANAISTESSSISSQAGPCTEHKTS